MDLQRLNLFEREVRRVPPAVLAHSIWEHLFDIRRAFEMDVVEADECTILSSHEVRLDVVCARIISDGGSEDVRLRIDAGLSLSQHDDLRFGAEYRDEQIIPYTNSWVTIDSPCTGS